MQWATREHIHGQKQAWDDTDHNVNEPELTKPTVLEEEGHHGAQATLLVSSSV